MARLPLSLIAASGEPPPKVLGRERRARRPLRHGECAVKRHRARLTKMEHLRAKALHRVRRGGPLADLDDFVKANCRTEKPVMGKRIGIFFFSQRKLYFSLGKIVDIHVTNSRSRNKEYVSVQTANDKLVAVLPRHCVSPTNLFFPPGCTQV